LEFTALARPLAAVALLLLTLPLLAQEKKPLRWGTDPTGGAPFVFKDGTGDYTGFEVELAAYFGEKLGRKMEMVAGDWANLPQQLAKSADVDGGIDFVLNGYELRKDLMAKYAVTRPYYVGRVTLMARADNDLLNDWDDLTGKSVGVLGGAAGHKYVKKRYATGGEFFTSLSVDLRTNPDVANVIKLVNDKRLDATVQDSPTATHFLKEYPDLKQVGEPMQPGPVPGYFVIYYRKADAELGSALDDAIATGLKDGTFRRIYEKYGLWNADQDDLARDADKPWVVPDLPDEGDNRWPPLFGELLQAAGVTVVLAVLSFPLAMLMGLLLALGRVYGPLLVRVPCGVWVEVIRGTPLLLQLFVVYFLIPELFIKAGLEDWIKWLSPFVAGVLGLAINYSAYEAENYRAGLQAIPRGQTEAALALGMSRWTAIRTVVVPQAVRIVIPPVTNDFIALFKDTSACSILFVTELTRKYNELFNFNRDLVVELLFLTAGLYLLMSYPLAIVARRLEKHFAKGERGAA
jgi:polar amino acid transport system substrate-binding protein